ncbi:hypothetical protein ACEPAI_119 [Sanghuangporus weigelae]
MSPISSSFLEPESPAFEETGKSLREGNQTPPTADVLFANSSDSEATLAFPPLCKRHHLFYFSLATFRVGNQLFRVPRQGFERNSVVFRDMFSMNKGIPGPHEGDSDDNPIHVKDVAPETFQDFLLLLYSPYPTKDLNELQLDQSRWIGILSFAHKWKFKGIRMFVISKLEEFDFDEVSKVVLAHRYEISEWYMPAYIALAKRHEALSIHEAERLGFRFSVKMAQIRERRFNRSLKHLDADDMMLKVDISTVLVVGYPGGHSGDFMPLFYGFPQTSQPKK